ncbi:unnamed protein product [Leptosia nina]|uniref:Defensin n=1 Tax=Leptosia nina TaxID=320188 RepID=A0AAV1JQ37_9NEOP
MKVVAIAVLLATFVCITQAFPLQEDPVLAGFPEEYAEPLNPIEVFNEALQRSCVPLYCHNSCVRLGFYTGSCRSSRCYCRHRN